MTIMLHFKVSGRQQLHELRRDSFFEKSAPLLWLAIGDHAVDTSRKAVMKYIPEADCYRLLSIFLSVDKPRGPKVN